MKFLVIVKIINSIIKFYNFACCFVWVSNLVADIAGGKEDEGV